MQSAFSRLREEEDAIKVLAGRDVGVDCDCKVRGRTVDEVLKKASDHAKRYHSIKKVTTDYFDSWRTKVHDE